MTWNLVINSGIYLFANGFSQFLVFLIWLILPWYLKPDSIGIYSLVVFSTDFFSAFGTFGLDSAIPRFYADKNNIKKVFNAIWLMFLISISISILIFNLTFGYLGSLSEKLPEIFSNSFLLFSFQIIFNSLVNLIFIHFTAIFDSFSFLKFQILRGISSSMFALLFVHFGYDFFSLFYGNIISSCVILLIFLIFYGRDLIEFSIDFEIIRKIYFYSYPLMFYSIFGIFFSYFSRIALSQIVDLRTLGVYTFFLTIALQINGFLSSINRAWTPAIFRELQTDKLGVQNKIKKVALISVIFYLSIYSLFLICGRLFLFELIFRGVYLEKVEILLILALAPMFLGIYTAAYPIFYFEENTKTIFYLSIELAIFNLVSTLVLIKFFGLIGASASYLLNCFVASVAYLAKFRKEIGLHNYLLKVSFFLAISCSCGLYFSVLNSSFIFLIFSLLFANVATYYLFRLEFPKKVLNIS